MTITFIIKLSVQLAVGAIVWLNFGWAAAAAPLPSCALTVASVNPGSGVGISVSPPDGNGQSNGTTLFTRTFSQGTVVTLSAPVSTRGQNFAKWQQNGTDLSTNPVVAVKLDANHTLTASYVNPIVSSSQIVSVDRSGAPDISPTSSFLGTRPRITGITRLEDGRVHLKVAGMAGHRYRLLVSFDLASWTILADEVANAGGSIEFLDSGATGLPARFYSVVEP